MVQLASQTCRGEGGWFVCAGIMYDQLGIGLRCNAYVYSSYVYQVLGAALSLLH